MIFWSSLSKFGVPEKTCTAFVIWDPTYETYAADCADHTFMVCVAGDFKSWMIDIIIIIIYKPFFSVGLEDSM